MSDIDHIIHDDAMEYANMFWLIKTIDLVGPLEEKIFMVYSSIPTKSFQLVGDP